MDLKALLYRVVHRSKKSVEEIADQVGCSASLLYRAANPNDLQARFPLEKLLPLMFATDDFSILKHLAVRSGFLLFRFPGRVDPKSSRDLNAYQLSFADLFRILLQFRSGEINKEQCLSTLDDFLSSSLEIREQVDKAEGSAQ